MGDDIQFLIKSYLSDIEKAIIAVRSSFPNVSQLGDFVELCMEKKIPRQGELDNGMHYISHGIGCRFEQGDGKEVDIDIAPDTREEIFDPWRIRMYAESVECTAHISENAILNGCEFLAQKGTIRRYSTYWFARTKTTHRYAPGGGG